jgi:glutaminyl-peptide cyclotransferase
MHCSKALILCLWCLACLAGDFSGAQALEYTRQIVAFGPRMPASEGMKKQQDFLLAQLKTCGCQVSQDDFVAKTPKGPVAMKNIIARFLGTNGRALVVTGHYDTKTFSAFRFVGANDGGSSSGFLLEMARALKGAPHASDIYLVWLDGEEAYGDWSETDSLYGSRQLAAKWAADGTLARVQALINVDMIGDKDLSIVQEQYSAESLRRLVWQVAQQLGYGRNFSDSSGAIEDDHVPFLRRGVRALDLIDFEYGPNHSWWHTAQDTVDKLSASSFQVVGSVIMETLRRLDNR